MYSLFDYEDRAQQVMSTPVYEFVASGAADENSLRWNRESFDKIRLLPRVLIDVSKVDTRVNIVGQEMAFPILLAPTAFHRLHHPEGEIATAQGAGAAGATFVVSSYTTTPIEEISRAATQPLWFQLYIQQDRGFVKDIIQRVEAAGCRALCVTVDVPVHGCRNRTDRSGFMVPDDFPVPYLMSRDLVVNQITWKDVEWLLSITNIPILLKGILNPADANRAVDLGVSGVIVSNHGARDLDTTPATIDALPRVAEVVDGRICVLMDGGIRRGTDVIKAIARGANAVLIGRSYCYGLAVSGAEGVSSVVNILKGELETAMALVGCTSISEIDKSILWDEVMKRD